MKKQEDKIKASFWDCLEQYFKAYNFSLQVILAVGLGCAAFLLDYYDIPSQIIINTPSGVHWPVICALAVLVVVWLLEFHIFDLFAITSENPLDVIATVTILASIFYVPARMIILGKCIYTQFLVCVAVASLLVIVIRLAVRHCRQKKVYSESSNLIDLKALYEGTFTRVENNPILTFEALACQIWGEEYIDIKAKTIHNLMSRVRHKLQVHPSEPEYIKSVRGVGYKFESE